MFKTDMKVNGKKTGDVAVALILLDKNIHNLSVQTGIQKWPRTMMSLRQTPEPTIGAKKPTFFSSIVRITVSRWSSSMIGIPSL